MLEPATEFVDGWHLGAIAEHLTALTTGQIRNLVITMPPRHMKSIALVLWCAWEWTFQPWTRWLCASYAATLSTRDSLKTRRVIESPWYQRRWGHVYQLTTDQNAKTRFENDQTGYRIATSVDAAATGEGGDRIIVDDPHNVKRAESEAVREATVRWWRESMSTRGNNPKTVARLVVQQRVHQQDLAGEMIESGDYDVLLLPAEYEPSRSRVTAIGWTDPRTHAGELLWPERFGKPELEGLKRILGSYAAAGQLQQRPAPAGGGIVKSAWWRYYDALPPVWEQMLLSLDSSFKAESDSDYIAIHVWARLGADVYLLDRVHARLEFLETTRALRFVAYKHPAAALKLVEDKANGPAIISTLRHRVGGIVAYEPDGDKVARTRAAAPFIEAGNVWLPGPAHAKRIHQEWLAALVACPAFVPAADRKELAPKEWLPPDEVHPDWVDRFVGEWSVFPKGANDDDVDAGTQAIRRLMQGHIDHGALAALQQPVAQAGAQVPATSAVIGQRF